MKNIENTKLLKYPGFTYNPKLDERKGTPMFTEKVNEAIEIFKKYGEPSDSLWEEANQLFKTDGLNSTSKVTSLNASKLIKTKRKPRKQKPQPAKV
jgi:hypothetical protein